MADELRYYVRIMYNRIAQNAHKDTPRHAPDEDRLYLMAEPRAGYFTAAEALAAGYSRNLLAHHARAGMLERVEHGIYRLRRFPESANADVVIAWLRAGERAAISHESALALYELSDVLPVEVHITVPRSSSRRRAGLRLHTGALDPSETTNLEGIRVTTVERTIADVARSGLSDELVLQAAQDALARGLTTKSRLTDAAARYGGRAKRLIGTALSSVSP